MGCMQSTPATEPIAPTSNKSAVESAPAPAPASQSVAAPEPEIEATPLSAAAPKYKITGVTITETGVVFYLVESVEGSLAAKRRYNDFKALYAELGHTSGLPALPQGGVGAAFRGKHNQELIKEREQQFALILNAVAGTPALAQSAAFQKFLSTEA